MTLALAVTLQLLAGAIPRCYFVTNTDILVLPSCDIGPATVGALTERPPPSRSTAQQRPPQSWRRGRANMGTARSVAVPAGTALDPNTLARRLEAEQRRRIAAEAGRITAESERDAALRELEAARRALASVPPGSGKSAAARPAGRALRVTVASGIDHPEEERPERSPEPARAAAARAGSGP